MNGASFFLRHIHCNKDQVIPLKKSVHPDYVVKDGPH